jgi:hypothetical protein
MKPTRRQQATALCAIGLAIAPQLLKSEPELQSIAPSPQTLNAVLESSERTTKTFHLAVAPEIFFLEQQNVLSVNQKFKADSWSAGFQGLAAEDLGLGFRVKQPIDFMNRHAIVTAAFDDRIVSERDFHLGVAYFLAEHEWYSHTEFTQTLMGNVDGELMAEYSDALLPVNQGAFDENLGHASGRLKITILNVSNSEPGETLHITDEAVNELLKGVYEKQSKFQKKANRGKVEPELLSWSLAAEAGEGSDLAVLIALLHEAGHQAMYRAEHMFPNNVSAEIPVGQNISQYGMSSPGEAFAEGYVWFILDPEGMQERAPEYYRWIDSVWTLAQK